MVEQAEMSNCKSFLVLLLLCLLAHQLSAEKYGSKKLMFEWLQVEYDWASQTQKQSYLQSGKYVVEHNAITGVKVWNDTFFVTVPRWFTGVPSTLNKVVTRGNSSGDKYLVVLADSCSASTLPRLGDARNWEPICFAVRSKHGNRLERQNVDS